jgi:hypothetical protein
MVSINLKGDKNMSKNYKYENTHLKPQIAKELIIELFSGKTVSRCEIDKAVIQYHESQGGLSSTAKTNPIRTALRYLKEKGLAARLPSRRPRNSTERPALRKSPMIWSEMVKVFRSA